MSCIKGHYFLCVKPSGDKVERFADRLCFSKGRRADKQVIAANPAVTQWLGERMDLSMAIDGLMYKRAAPQEVGMSKH
jgi:hypothetical protein